MAMSYTSLTADKSAAGSLQRWVSWSELDSDACIEEAQAWIYERLRVRQMRKSAMISVLTGDEYADLPDDFLDPITRIRDITGGGVQLNSLAEDRFDSIISWTNGVMQSGTVCSYAIFDERINFDVASSQDVTLSWVYYGQPEMLSEDNETNFLTKRYPHLLRAVAQEFAFEQFKQDDGYQRNMIRAEQMIVTANATDEMSRRTEDNSADAGGPYYSNY